MKELTADVARRRCVNQGCSKPSHGLPGYEAGFCFKHARAGIVAVAKRMCGDGGCSKTPS